MRTGLSKIWAVIMAVMLLASVADASPKGKDKGKRGKKGSYARVYDWYDRDDNYGRRRSRLAHRQNAERRALKSQYKEERRFARGYGYNRRDLARDQREESRWLRERHQRQRRAIRP